MAGECEKLKKIACDAIDQKLTDLHKVSQELWENPELGLEEYKAHDLLTGYLEKEGFPVERKYVLDTAFRSIVGSNDSGPHVAVLCEYDALPNIGHACGHNLIAEVGIAAGLGIKAALDSVDGKLGKMIVLGTPAEEGIGGKTYLIENGVFKSIDLSVMAHPWATSCAYIDSFLARVKVDVKYIGRASHAAGFPWEGINALDAAVMAYNNISVLRQQMKPSWRVHGVFTNGGAKPNIIPEEAALQYYVRAPKMAELKILKEKMIKCFEGAAAATGCKVELTWDPRTYENMLTNDCLAQLYTTNATHLGIDLQEDESTSAPTGSTDMGNVSHVVPSIHPMFYIGTKAANHTRDFTTAAGDPKAQAYTIKQAKALAMTAIDVFCNPELVPKMKAQFDEDIKKDSQS